VSAPSSIASANEPGLGRDDFLARLKSEGERRYHDRHPFHLRMHAGELSRTQIQGWVLNRYYYQTRIPIKDAILLSKSEDPEFRRQWIRRIHDHDGVVGRDGKLESEGGLSLWLRLAEGVGLDRDEVKGLTRVLPAVRFACDAYVELVRSRSLVEAVASSLTEFFSPEIMSTRLKAWEKHYPWVDAGVQEYFRSRVPRARNDSTEALDFVMAHATTRAAQDLCIAAFITKCDVLWSLLDAVSLAYGG
jgi:pyrroloquinoline-quinone synthase